MRTLIEKLPVVVRSLLGLTFLVFGLNGFFQFLPQPAVAPEAGAFLGGLVSAKYLFPLLKGTEVVAGLLLLTGRFVPLALTLLAPVIVNIAGFHLFLSPGVGMVAFLLGSELYLAWAYRDAFRPMLAARVEPARSALAPEPATRPLARAA